MAFQGNDVKDPKKLTEWTADGKPIIVGKSRGRPPQRIRTRLSDALNSEKKKFEVLALYAVTGNVAEVARLTGIAKSTIQSWKKEQWWTDGLEDIRSENDVQFDVAFTKILEKVVGGIDDRLINGDEVILKDGSKAKRAVSLRDLVGALAYTIDKRQLIRGRPTTRTETVSVENRLEKLVNHFTNLAKRSNQTDPKGQDKQVVEKAPTKLIEAPSEPQPIVVEDTPQPMLIETSKPL